VPESILASKYGCKECWEQVRGLNMRLSQEEFERRANVIHKHKYSYGTFTKTDETITIECTLHGIFEQNAGNHLAGMGCPTCGIHQSKAQNDWLDKLGVKNREVWIAIGHQKIKADGYDDKTKTIYEFWGDYWHGNPKIYDQNDINTTNGKTFGNLYDKTLNKRTLITDNGYNLIEIWENDWRKINGKTTKRSIRA
jgi:hypothetical protein